MDDHALRCVALRYSSVVGRMDERQNGLTNQKNKKP
jgi:hypothetical protein